MIITPIAQKVLRLEYRLLRVPLGVLDSQVSRRLSDRSSLRLTLERGLATCDAAAAHLLGDISLAQRAETSHQHADTIERSVDLADQAAELRAAAGRKQDMAEDAREKGRRAARVERERVAQAVRDGEKAKEDATERARVDAAAKKREASQRATARQQQARKDRVAKENRAVERAQRATAPARAALKNAAKEKASASERRGDAQTLSTLAAAEKRKRRSEVTSSTTTRRTPKQSSAAPRRASASRPAVRTARASGRAATPTAR